MKGIVLDFNHKENIGLILGSDGKRYSFNYLNEWKSSNKIPELHEEVDFLEKDNIAIEIFSLSKKTEQNSNSSQDNNINSTFKKINFEQIESEINHYIETNPQIKKNQKKESIKAFFISLSITILTYILSNILFSYKWDFFGLISSIAFLLGCLVTLIFVIIVIFMSFTPKEKLDNAVTKSIRDEKIFEVYSNSLTILNYVPDNLNYQVIKMISSSSRNYDDAKKQLIRQAYELKADAILNLKDNTNSTSDVKSSFIPGTNTQQIKTNVITTHRLEGIAIKLNS